MLFFIYVTILFVYCSIDVESLSVGNRRAVLQKACSFGIISSSPFLYNNIANAVDKQFAEVEQQQASPNGESPFSTLSNGVQIKDFRVGSGATVQQGSKVVSYIFDVYDVHIPPSILHCIVKMIYHMMRSQVHIIFTYISVMK